MPLLVFSSQLIETNFGDGEINGAIDVDRLMVSLGLRLPEGGPERREIADELGIEEGIVRLDRSSTDMLDTLDPAVPPAIHPMDTLDPAVDPAVDPIHLFQPSEGPLDLLHPAVETKQLPVGLGHASAELGTNGEEKDPSGEPSRVTLEDENARYAWSAS